jgi:hypothetical protein
MNALPPPAVRRLAGALSLAASTSGAPPGERLAAIGAAERLLATAGLALPDLARALDPNPATAAPWAAPRERDAGGLPPWREMLAALLDAADAGRLTEWEAGFIVSISRRWSLSPKQAEVLARLFRERCCR